MATLKIETPEYWDSKEIDIRLNPGVKFNTHGLKQLILDRGIDSAVVLATSGSQGEPKYVVLKKKAILHAAQAVNHFCSIDQTDRWLGGLSTFHIGGLAIYARAVLSSSEVSSMNWNSWTRDGSAFIDAIGQATLTSLTPIHLYDLVNHQVPCPQSLRGVFIGGGKLEHSLAKQARQLGYPIWTTFGMTETASQIATSLEGKVNSLPILPHWQTKVDEFSRLKVKGHALMSGYFTRIENQWQWHKATNKDEFFETGDLVAIENNCLTPLGRADQQIKILGELVSLVEIESKLSDLAGCNCIVWSEPDPRRGFALFACFESKQKPIDLEPINKTLPPFKHLQNMYHIDNFPRTEVGKIDRKTIIQGF